MPALIDTVPLLIFHPSLVVGGFVGHDLGVAIVPDMAVYDLLPIKKIKIKDIDEKQTFYMAYLKNTQKSKAFLEFIEHVNCDVL